jgi:hypothetical protein
MLLQTCWLKIGFNFSFGQQVSYLIVDEIHNEHPELIRDQYWDNVNFNMPYTMGSQQFRVKNPLMGSVVDLT